MYVRTRPPLCALICLIRRRHAWSPTVWLTDRRLPLAPPGPVELVDRSSIRCRRCGLIAYVGTAPP